MQSLTTPASVSKRKQACKSCRQRKKRCDGDRPTCGLCKKWGLKCEYSVPASARANAEDSAWQFTPTLFGRQPFLPLDGNYSDVAGLARLPFLGSEVPEINPQGVMSSHAGYPSPSSGLESFSTGDALGIDRDILPNSELPPGDLLDELIDLFFESLHHVFPCFHKTSFMAELRSGHLLAQSPLLLYSICCVAASFHPDPLVKSRQNDWYEQAKFLYEFTGRDPHPALRTIQAVLCLVFHAYTKGDFSSCWLHLGKAWRQAAALGMNRMDSPHAIVMGLNRMDTDTPQAAMEFLQRPPGDAARRGYFNKMEWKGKTAIEREECRRTLWLLFIMDRNESWPTGWPNAIEERQFKVDIPVTESVFQAMTPETDPSTTKNTPFTRSFKGLLSSASLAKEPLNLFHYLVIAHVLLGRVADQIHSLHDNPNTPEYAEECEELDRHLVKLRLSLPRSATSVLDTPPENRGYVVWLNLILNTISMLLHYRCAKFSDHETAQELFTKAVIAAKSTAQIVKDTARISIELLLSTHVASSLYIAACVLVIHWRTEGDASCEDSIDMFGLVFERMNDVFSVIGIKFKLALQRDLERNKEEISNLRESGYRGLLADCSKWGFVQEEVAKLGMTIS